LYVNKTHMLRYAPVLCDWKSLFQKTVLNLRTSCSCNIQIRTNIKFARQYFISTSNTKSKPTWIKRVVKEKIHADREYMSHDLPRTHLYYEICRERTAKLYHTNNSQVCASVL
jgi:hypothetical protein